MAGSMTASTLDRALRRTAALADLSEDVEITVIGGAAAILTGLLPATRTTGDVDVVGTRPPESIYEIADAARRAGEEMGLPANWLNDHAQSLFGLTMPAGWMERRTLLDHVGRLRIYVINRSDWIALKVLAARDVDVADLADADVTREELSHAETYVDDLERRGDWDSERLRSARDVLAAFHED